MQRNNTNDKWTSVSFLSSTMNNEFERTFTDSSAYSRIDLKSVSNAEYCGFAMKISNTVPCYGLIAGKTGCFCLQRNTDGNWYQKPILAF